MPFSNEQLKAIQHMSGPALVLAGPGSGKTTVLTKRAANLIEHNVNPKNILIITFTKNSANEMEGRFIDKYSNQNDVFEIPSFSTIHSLACRIIGNSKIKYEIIDEREQTEILNYASKEARKKDLVTVTGDKFNKMILSEISHYNNVFNDEMFSIEKCKKILSKKFNDHISLKSSDNTDLKENARNLKLSLKNSYSNETTDSSCYINVSDASINDIILINYKPAILTSSQFNFIYNMYTKILNQRRLITYDDMVKSAINILQSDHSVLSKFRKAAHFTLVDEFQDTDLSQLYLIMLLLGNDRNLFAVGDEDQSIYSFRGANPDIMLKFKDIFPGASIYRLENNYRCAGEIVNLSSSLIRNNVNRYKKKFIAVREDNGDVSLIKAEDENSEAVVVFQFIKELINENHSENINENDNQRKSKNKNITADTSVCILARTNQSLKRIANLLMAENIDFYLKDRIDNIFEKDLFKILIMFLKASVDFYDSDSFYIILYIADIGIRPNSINGKSDVYSNMIRYAAGDELLIKKINEFREQMKFIGRLPAAAAIIFVENQFKVSRYICSRDEYKNIKPEDLKEDISFLSKLSSGFSTVKDFMKYISEYGEHMKSSYEKSVQAVNNNHVNITISTIHSSKGLEYDSVWIMGANEGSIPSRKALTPGAIEEERRLFYVAITRAKNTLYISFHNRERGKICKSSRFLQDINIHIKN